MGEPQACKHGVRFARDAKGQLPFCPHCDLIWHEARLIEAEAAVARHKRKIRDAIATISRTCGDA